MNLNKPKRVLKRAREQRSITLQALSTRSGIALETLQAYERNAYRLKLEDYEVLKPLLHLEQFNVHIVKKTYRPNHLLDFFTIKAYKAHVENTFLVWLQNGIGAIWKTIKTDKNFKQLMGLLLITALLGSLTDQLAVETLIYSALVPVGLSILMFKYVKEKNLRALDAFKLFIYGGLTSMALVFLIRDITGFYDGFIGDLITGFVEEIAKVMIVLYALKRINIQTIRGGMLIGFLIGAGFDVFETADYAIWTYMSAFDYEETYGVMMIRSVFALFGIGHHFWTAMLAGALVYLKQTDYPKTKNLIHPGFIEIFVLVVIVHASWNYFTEFSLFHMAAVTLFSGILFLCFLRHASLEETYNNHQLRLG